MEKKESKNKQQSGQKPESDGGVGKLKNKISGLTNRLFSVIKLTLGICLIPFVYGVSVSFVRELAVIDKPVQDWFWTGVLAFLVVYLFIWEPAVIYARGQKFLEITFSFFSPLVKVAPYLLPIYAVMLVAAYNVLAYLFPKGGFLDDFVFLLGFSMALHIVFGAKSLKSKQTDFLKANYVFGFSFLYILNIILLVFCFNILFEKISFVNFFNNSYQIGREIVSAVFKQLFFIR